MEDPTAASFPAPKPPPSPPEAWEPLLRIARLADRLLKQFLRTQTASGVVLLVSAAVALVWANSPWAQSYIRLWKMPLGIRVGALSIERPLQWIINDVLMVVFFFVAALEIRRELHHGELSSWRRAMLPAAAALGGMVTPALLYLAIADGASTRAGWGVPTATDIAFAVGVLSLLGKRVPAALRVLLLSIAVMDDLGAVVVIAVFYTSDVAWIYFLVAAGGVAGVFALQRFGVRRKAVYMAPALIAWVGIYKAGVHPTIAGVLVGFATPVRAWMGPTGFKEVRDGFDRLTRSHKEPLSEQELADTLRQVDHARREALSPAASMLGLLSPWVALVIMPLFALANAGVQLGGMTGDSMSIRIALGAAVGLVLGKPIGVMMMSALALRVGVAALPRGLRVSHLLVLAVVAGVGFTMALFIAQLAFVDAKLLAAAKLGVLGASLLAGCLGVGLGRWLLPPAEHTGAAETDV